MLVTLTTLTISLIGHGPVPLKGRRRIAVKYQSGFGVRSESGQWWGETKPGTYTPSQEEARHDSTNTGAASSPFDTPAPSLPLFF